MATKEQAIMYQRIMAKSNPIIGNMQLVNIDTEYNGQRDCSVKCLICGKEYKNEDIKYRANKSKTLPCCSGKLRLVNSLDTVKKQYIDNDSVFKSLDGYLLKCIDVKITAKNSLKATVQDIKTKETQTIGVNRLKTGNFYFNKKAKNKVVSPVGTPAYDWLEENNWMLCGRHVIKETFLSLRQCEVICDYCGKPKARDLTTLFAHKSNPDYTVEKYMCSECTREEKSNLAKNKIIGLRCVSKDGFNCEVINYKKSDGNLHASYLVAEINNNKHQRWIQSSQLKKVGFNLDVRKEVFKVGHTLVTMQGCNCTISSISEGNKELVFLDGTIAHRKRDLDKTIYPKILSNGTGRYLGYKLQGFACGSKPIGNNLENLYYNVLLDGKISILRPCDLEKMYKNANE